MTVIAPVVVSRLALKPGTAVPFTVKLYTGSTDAGTSGDEPPTRSTWSAMASPVIAQAPVLVMVTR